MVQIKGIGFTKVGEFWEKTFEDLLVEAISKATEDANLSFDAITVAYIPRPISPHITSTDVARVVRGILPKCRKIITIDCGTNGLIAVETAAREAGNKENVLVVGVEKLSDFKSYEQESIRMNLLGIHYRLLGIPASAVHALLLRMYMKKWNAPHENIAKLAEITHTHAAGAKHAKYRFKLPVKKILASPILADPLRMFEFSSLSDGAAAVILSQGKTGVIINDVKIANDSLFVLNCSDDLQAKNIAEIARDIGTTDVDFVELHDESTILGVLQLEWIGISKLGEAHKLVGNGDVELGGKIPVCTFGGLKGRGDVASINALYQIAEATLQIRGEADNNQVDNAKSGLVVSLHGINLSAGLCKIVKV